jgi:hypothetical protein
MHLDRQTPSHLPSAIQVAPAKSPVGRYLVIGGAVVAAGTWSLAVLTILVIALAIGAMSVAVLGAVVKSILNGQHKG